MNMNVKYELDKDYEAFYDPIDYQSGIRKIDKTVYILSEPRFVGAFPKRVDIECIPSGEKWTGLSSAED